MVLDLIKDNDKAYNMNELRYNFKEIKITDFSKVGDAERKEIIIVKEYKDGRGWFHSEFTSYLKSYCSGMSLNSKLKEARFITNFLNYINHEIEVGENPIFNILEEKGIYALNLYHLQAFINSLKNINSRETVLAKKRVLLKFYDFLYQLGYTGESAKIEKVQQVYKVGGRKKVVKTIVDPFEGNPHYYLNLPSAEAVKRGVLKDMDDDIWNAFLNYARKNHPNIALGVAFQICGGLRQGEVVNLTIDSVELKKEQNFITLNICDRQAQLFARNINTRYSQVKKPRSNQPVFNFTGELFDIWDEHIHYLNSIKNRKNMSALFIDSKGNPMAGATYQYEFQRLKINFIDFIKRVKPSAADKLESQNWGSHIGRHIFTNHLIDNGYIKNILGENDPKVLMILRGDTSPQSAQDYMDIKTLIEGVANSIDTISAIACSERNKYKEY